MTAVRCSQCSGTLADPGEPPVHGEAACTLCGTRVELETFPALRRGIAAGRTGATSLPEEATCFIHAEKRAEAACDQCGRFMCALCEIRIGEKRFCPTCFEASRRSRAMPHFEKFRLLYSHLAVIAALLALAFSFFGMIFGPLVMGLAVFGFFKRNSITGRREYFSATLGFVLGLAETIALALFAFSFFR